jgi:hypothetical protein
VASTAGASIVNSNRPVPPGGTLGPSSAVGRLGESHDSSANTLARSKPYVVPSRTMSLVQVRVPVFCATKKETVRSPDSSSGYSLWPIHFAA